MDHQWLEWGLESARDFADAGFCVFRIQTQHWKDLQSEDPSKFEDPWLPSQNQQQLACSLNMRDTLRPVLEEFSTFWQQKLVDTVDIEELMIYLLLGSTSTSMRNCGRSRETLCAWPSLNVGNPYSYIYIFHTCTYIYICMYIVGFRGLGGQLKNKPPSIGVY